MSCLVVQPPHYPSSTSMEGPEIRITAPPASYPGVTNKVSAWLQQTHNIDATANGKKLCVLHLH